MTDEIKKFSPSILVFANAREVTDRLLTTACRLASPSTKIVMELPNLYPMVRTGDVDVIIGPSWWALEHYSVGGNVGRDINEDTLHEFGIKKINSASYHVITPGVDTKVFSLEGPIACLNEVSGSDSFPLLFGWKDFHNIESPSRCKSSHVTIGFVARLSPEKSPGVFVQAAKAMLATDPFLRFVVVGGGRFMDQMVEMTSVFEVQRSFEFVGALYGEELVSVMRGIDIIVNPSMRYESETFCIANIEAMR